MKSWEIIQVFSKKERTIFTFAELKKEMPGISISSLAQMMETLIKNKQLARLSNGIFYIIPANGAGPNQNLIAKYLAKDTPYYIGYHSAMIVHGLTKTDLKERFIVCHPQKRPTRVRVADMSFRFLMHAEKKFFGFEDRKVNKYETAKYSDLEKTIVDICDRPQFAGGIEEVAKALTLAAKRTNQDKLLFYFASNGNLAAIKRYLFITDLLGLEWTKGHDKLLSRKGNNISLLEPGKQKGGKTKTEFGLKINVDTEQLKRTFNLK